MTTLKLATHISLPIDAATQKISFIGRSGSGKTYGAGKFAELLLDSNVQTVVMDNIGNWWGLRVGKDGRSEGLKIPIIGGVKGDVPIESNGGNAVADLIVDTGSSMIVDVSEFTGGEMRRFVMDFATHLLHRKKQHKSPVMIIWEECQDVVPQRVMGEEAKMLGAMEKLIKKGRNYGIGTTLISQRPQAVNKDVLNQTECMIVFQLTAPHERKAIEDWVRDKALDKNPVSELPKLKQGECFIWSPSWLQIFERTKILQKQTFDASATPEFGQNYKAANLTPIDLEKFADKMKSSIEKAKLNDPKELHKTIAELRKQLNAGSKNIPNPAEIIQLRERATKAENVANGYLSQLKKVQAYIEKLKAQFSGFPEIELNGVAVMQYPIQATPIKQRVEMAERIMPINPEANASLSKCERAILAALAQRDKPTSKSALGILSGYSSSSGGFNNSLSKLRQSEYIKGSGDQIQITDDGIGAIGNDYELLPVGEQLHQFWYRKLSKAEGTILRVLINSHPNPMDKTTIGEQSEYSATSGGFNNALSRLRTLELIEGYRDDIKASDSLFI